MSKTLQQILGGENMTGVIQSVAGGVPEDILPPAFLTPGRTVDGDTATYFKVESTRRAAQRKAYGSKAAEVDKQGITEQPVKLIHTVEKQRHGATTLVNLKGVNGEGKQRLGEQEVDRQTVEFARRFRNLRLSSVYSALSFGAIYFNAAGDLATSSSTVNIDFGVPANNKTQLNGLIDAAWDVAGTKIITQIKNIKAQARKLTGLPIRHAFYGANIPDFLLTNTQIKEMLNRNPRAQARLVMEEAGEIPDGLLGLSWHPVNEAFTDIAGSNTDWFAVDKIVFTPDPSPDWYELIEGTYPVPTSVGIAGGSAADALANFNLQAGMFSYGKVTDDPPSIEHVAGDTFLPIVKNGNAVFIADVDF